MSYTGTMPAPHPINREELKAFCLATSLAEGARKWNLPLSTVRNMAKRQGWRTPTKIKREREKLAQEEKQIAEARGMPYITAGDALEEHFFNSTKTFRSGVASALSRIGETASGMDGETALDNARRLKDASDIARIVLGIGSDVDAPKLNLNILALGAAHFAR